MGGQLTPRQRDMIYYGALGMSDKEIATALGLAEHSVHVYMSRLRKRFGNLNRQMLPAMGLLMGVVSIAEMCGPALLILQAMIPGDD